MFLQNLKKRLFNFLEKVSTLFTDFNFKQFIEENFINIIKVFSLIGILIVSIIIIVGLINIGSNKRPLKKGENIVIDKKESLVDKNFLIDNEFLYPEISFMDITIDYKEFMPLKKRRLPEFSEVINDYDYIFKESIDESLKFNFEKRRGR